MIVLYILLFIFCLSVLIMIHELGHLLTAKMFKVYCFEYAIGFGPKLFSFKRKGGETAFSLRAIPFGGFVSMYGEAETVPEGLEIDPSRSLLAIKRWKRAIIMVAGVTMNFLLALVVFFIYEIAFPAMTPHYSHVSVNNPSLAYEVGLRTGDLVYSSVSTPEDRSYVLYNSETIITYSDNTTKTGYFGFDYGSITLKDTALVNRTVAYPVKANGALNITTYTEKTVTEILAATDLDETTVYKTSGYISAIGVNKDKKAVQYLITQDFTDEKPILVENPYDNDDEYNKFIHFSVGEKLTVIGNMDLSRTKYKCITVKEKNYVTNTPDFATGNLLKKPSTGATPTKITFNVTKVDKNDKSVLTNYTFLDQELVLDGDYYKLKNNVGLNMQIEENWHDFGTAVKNTFVDFGDGAVVIFKSLGMLLTDANSWKDVSGLIGIGVISTQVLEQNGLGQFLRLWALISVNLGIVNLLPFPGLDGWQLLVLAVEGIFRKEIPAKVKSWVSIVGIALLFALMIAILIKDIITFI